jgi:predicted negative regulator of RcsB-dependent stress response
MLGRAIAKAVGSLVGTLLFLFFLTSQGRVPGTVVSAQQSARADAGYVGSRACAKCHPSIYESFLRTDMGRSMSEITPALLERIPSSASIFDPKLNRHFEVYARDGHLYQSEYATSADGKDVFRETRKVEWIIGSGANGSGAIVKQDDFLFEAPLSFYTKPHQWGLSPGYEFGDYGFDRPILPGCIVCHSGQPRPILDGNGRFKEPPFAELAIGCENCHGPGEAHVTAAQMGSLLASIVNPAKLSPWSADNICMSCHQTGDARVLQQGKTYRDFRPGAELDDTLSVFLVPFGRESAPKDDLLEHYLSMRLSKCYLSSGGRLSCISCHDPHVQPSQQQAPEYFRQKCLACHTQKSCAVPLSLRQHKTPPDDCAGCHMPKRDVTVISHSVLTNHRIIAEAEELFPDVAFHMTTLQLPDLVHLSANPAKQDAPSPLTRLQAYAQVMLAHPDYRMRYWSLAQQLKATHAENVYVLEALADEAVQKHDAEGSSLAIRYLQAAILHGATNPVDFEELAELLVTANRQSEAIDVLRQGMQMDPYDAVLYRLSTKIYFAQNKIQEACEVAAKGAQNFPQDDALRSLMSRCGTAPAR